MSSGRELEVSVQQSSCKQPHLYYYYYYVVLEVLDLQTATILKIRDPPIRTVLDLTGFVCDADYHVNLCAICNSEDATNISSHLH